MSPQPKMPPELAIENRYSNDYGPMYLAMILKCWCSADRDDCLGPTLRSLIDCELYWVVDDVLGEKAEKNHILIAEAALNRYIDLTLRKMLAISRRKVSKSRRSQYQGVETGDMKLAGIMSLFVSLVDQADDFVTDALTSETIQPKRLSPPKQK